MVDSAFLTLYFAKQMLKILEHQHAISFNIPTIYRFAHTQDMDIVLIQQ